MPELNREIAWAALSEMLRGDLLVLKYEIIRLGRSKREPSEAIDPAYPEKAAPR